MSASAAPVHTATAENSSIPTFEPERTGLPRTSIASGKKQRRISRSSMLENAKAQGVARRTLGIVLLLVTVFLWTASNFLASTIFADNSYSKPYFVTYVNTSFFSIFLVFILVQRLWACNGSITRLFRGERGSSRDKPSAEEENEAFLKPDNHSNDNRRRTPSPSNSLLLDDRLTHTGEIQNGPVNASEGALNVWETSKLSLEFCILWFVANYFVAACLNYTTVASSTILTSTSSIWTLLLGAFIKVEKFTLKKLVGVLTSLAGVALISSVDLSGDNDENRGTFPHKSQRQLAIGDAIALASAVIYGLYTVIMKKRIGDESRVSMPLFFGFVGLFNMFFLWPGFFVLHFTGVERFQLPPTRRILAIVLVNSTTSLLSDFCWAYAMLLTSPLVVTVGLSLSIPLSLVGQMILNSQTSSVAYWIGAGIVFLSFIFINHESKEEDEQKIDDSRTSEPPPDDDNIDEDV
ncbi:hypothetical protein MMC24_003932 [Lignoscripta atroalba]|nr:hypothetical protein [Lignoscripta atroalba]